MSLTALIVAICLSFIIFSGCNNAEKKEKAGAQQEITTVVVAEAVKKTVPIVSEYVATVDASTGGGTVNIQARVEAFLMNQCFKEGDPVKKGQVLFLLDSRTYKAALLSAKASLDKATSDLAYAKEKVSILRAKADLESSKAALAYAALNERRLKPLAQEKAVPQQDYDSAATNLEMAKDDVAAKEAAYTNSVLTQKTSVEQAQAAVESAKAAVQQAEINLGYCTVTSPIDGIAGKRMVTPGNLVGRGEATLLTTVTSLDPIRVIFNGSETDYLRLMEEYIVQKDKKGQKNRKLESPKLKLILADGSVYPYKGRVIVIQPSLDPNTGTMMIIGEFSNPQHLLRPGMFGRIQLVIDHDRNATVIPQMAVSILQSANVAYVVGADNKVALRTLTLGDQVGNMVVVKEGVKPGDKVIVEGQLKVRPGMVVKPEFQPATKEPGEN
ncbi:MAG: efflux RND transporter periplasmic adaptor subunit [Chloroflexi bacterium]|nr:efflux RND transporter periplasmic adaptor subunit [Chloroflexota bacterium]